MKIRVCVRSMQAQTEFRFCQFCGVSLHNEAWALSIACSTQTCLSVQKQSVPDNHEDWNKMTRLFTFSKSQV